MPLLLRTLVLGLVLLASRGAWAQTQFPALNANGQPGAGGVSSVVPMCITTAGADVGPGIAVVPGTHGTAAGCAGGGGGSGGAGSSASAPSYTAPAPSTSSSVGIAPVASTATEAGHVLKASAGNLYGLTVTTGTTAGYVLLLNAATIPADGAVQPLDCYQQAANTTLSVGVGGAPPEYFSAGIVAVFSTTGCLTKTGSATAFFSGKVS